MCGIAGLLARGTSANIKHLNQMLDKLVHRGPDETGVFTDCSFAMGSRRLSIVDAATGQQPMQSDNGRYCLVFNGEIYNHIALRRELESDHQAVFITDSDTEVLLQAYQIWETSAFERFNGMFAAAIWDSRDQLLTLVRDRLGEKPLYYHKGTTAFLFASEIKALLTHPRCPRRPALDRLATGLIYRFVPGAENYFDEIESLSPGHWMQINGQGDITVQPHPFWSVSDVVKGSSTAFRDTSSLTDQLHQELTNSIKLRLSRLSSSGLFLSGGLDSSLLLALANQNGYQLKTFAAGFDTGRSEHSKAAMVARHFSAEHHTTIVTASDFNDTIPCALYHRESPVSEPSDIALYMLAKQASQHVRIVLSGEGADELFMGYPKYVATHHLRHLPTGLISQISGILKRSFNRLGTSSSLAIAARSLEATNFFDQSSSWFGAFSRRDLLHTASPLLMQYQNHIHNEAQNTMLSVENFSLLIKLQLLDLQHWLPANLLLRSDRMTMAHSLELRCPFLDPAIIKTALSEISTNRKIRGLTSKIPLHNLAKRILPPAIAQQSKWGFKVPVEPWLRSALKQTVRDALLSPEAVRRGYFNTSYVERLLHEHQNEGKNHSKQIWYLWQLELWHQKFIDSYHN